MIRRKGRMLAALASTALVVAACGSDDSSSGTTPVGGGSTTATTATSTTAGGGEVTTTSAGGETTVADTGGETTAATTGETTADTGAGGGWTVNTDDCPDPDAANAAIEGNLVIGAAMPLSGGVAATAFKPVTDGFQAYIDYANEQKLVPGVTLEFKVEDDQYNADLTPGAVDKLIDGGATIFAGILGTPDNLAVRDTLNSECIPQLESLTGYPGWGDVAEYPWTTGALPPYDIETKIYAANIGSEFPDGATAALYYTNSEFGQTYADTFKEEAGANNIEVVDEQTVEVTATDPPTSQIGSIASKKPDVIMAAPLGAACPAFLSELANAKAANAGWEPRVYITNTCVSALILAVAGASADGIYTTAYIKDINNPDVQADPKVKPFIDYMATKGLTDEQTTAAAGWTTAEVTVAILKQAAESDAGLTRASIMNAARNFEFTPQLVRDGITLKMDGEEDPFLVQSLQVVQYSAASGTVTDVGDLITDNES